MIAADSTKPIFVIGTPRSGTTLTARILGRHSRLFMPGETHYFEDIHAYAGHLGSLEVRQARVMAAERLHTIYERYYELPDQQRITRMFPTVSDLATELDSCRNYGALLNRFMSLQMQVYGKVRWGNNAPRDLFSIKEIRDYFPEAKLVVCVRDIRAFLYSYKGKWRVVGDEYVVRMKKLYHPVVTSYLWKSSMRQLPVIENIVPPADRIIVRYEDMVSDPEGVVRKICATIEEEFEPSMLAVDSHNSSSATEAEGIFASSVDRWKTELSQEEIAISQNIAGSLLGRLGYHTIAVRPRLIKMLFIWIVTPFALWRALAANKATRGPLIPYLFKRVGSLLGLSR